MILKYIFTASLDTYITELSLYFEIFYYFSCSSFGIQMLELRHTFQDIIDFFYSLFHLISIAISSPFIGESDINSIINALLLYLLVL
jgi:hypothetical protein